ncbi:MAG: FG-GAP repeat domain-containing protein [Candidatus Hydrogenedentota bacterium]
MNLLTAVLAASVAFLDIQDFPLPADQATCFLAPADQSEPPELFVLAGHTLTIYYDMQPARAHTFTLPEDTAAIDVFDLNGDGAVELIAVAGDSVLRRVLTPDGTETAAHELFEVENTLAPATQGPMLRVLGVVWEEHRLIGLPTDTHYTLFNAKGAPEESWPTGIDAPHHATYGQPFTATAVQQPALGPTGALEFDVRRHIAVEPELPRALPIRQSMAPVRVAARDLPTGHLQPQYWPAFPLAHSRRPTGVPAELAGAQVLHAPQHDAMRETTQIRLRTAGRGDEGDTYRIEPSRRYPGRLLNTRANMPDFNNDGLVDLALWILPSMAPTPGRLAAALAAGRWPIRIAMHFFQPSQRRFAPLPTAYVNLSLPTAWFLGGAARTPLRHVVLDDLDGDGRTDLACATGPRTFSVWRFREEGFNISPSWAYRFNTPIQHVVFRTPLDEGGGVAIALRTEKRLYVLRPEIQG